jgi:polysaccharide export outer membrane protein
MTRSRIGRVLVLGILTVSAAAAQQRPAQALVQYIRDARTAGLKDDEIQQNAQKAGWQTAEIAAAIQSIAAATPAGPAPKAEPKAVAAGPSDARPNSKETVTKGSIPATPNTGGTAAPANGDAGTPAGKTPAVDRGAPDDYSIGEGDILHISVWKEPDASVQSAVVRPDGKISMPMLKEVQASGMTPIQLEKAITEQLGKFISAPDVTVVVSAINSKKIYLLGGVKKEGPIPYTYRMTIMQALSEAGGVTDYAKKKKIYVLHYENGREYRFPFNYDAAVKGEGMELNKVLMPGDTVVVPK